MNQEEQELRIKFLKLQIEHEELSIKNMKARIKWNNGLDKRDKIKALKKEKGLR